MSVSEARDSGMEGSGKRDANGVDMEERGVQMERYNKATTARGNKTKVVEGATVV